MSKNRDLDCMIQLFDGECVEVNLLVMHWPAMKQCEIEHDLVAVVEERSEHMYMVKLYHSSKENVMDT